MSASDQISEQLMLALSAMQQIGEPDIEPAEQAAARDGLVDALDELAQLVHDNPAAMLPDIEVTSYGRLTIFRVAVAEKRPRAVRSRKEGAS